MRFGDFEGTPQEITDLFEVHGVQLSDYLQKPKEPLARRWLIIPAILLVAMVVVLIIAASMAKSALLLPFFVLGALALIWLSASIQIRFDSAWATGVVAVGGLVVLLLAGAFIGPRESLDAIRELKPK
jgi:peptidoglycan/LPS O-acetylase OafA/YrhL